MSAARLHFTSSSSAGFAITLATTNVATWISNGPNASSENLTCVSDWSTTTSQTCLGITATVGDNSTTFTRSLPPSVSVLHLVSISKTNSGGFATLLALYDISTSKIYDVSMWASSGDTTAGAVTVATSSSAVVTGLRFNGIRQQNGGTALTVTDYIQGIYVTDMQTVGSQHSISWTNPGGYTGADSLIVDHSQLNSNVSEIVTSNVMHVQVANNYLLAGAVGWIGVNISGYNGHTVTGNTFLSGAGDTTAQGVSLNNVTAPAITSNQFYGLTGGSASSGPIVLKGTTNNAVVVGNTTNDIYVVWDGSSGSNSIVGNNGTVHTANVYTQQNGLNVSGGNLNVVGSANNIGIGGATTGNSPTLQAFGSDSVINLNILAKGGGEVFIPNQLAITGNLFATGLATSGTIAGSLCATSGGNILYESGATGCTISLESVKKNIAGIDAVRALHDVMNIQPIAFEFKDPSVKGRRYGFGANQVHEVDPVLSTYDGKGDLQAFDPNGILAELVSVVQHQQAEINELKSKVH